MTGLIVAEDLLSQLPAVLTGTLVVLPEVMFNFDKLTLDGARLEDVIAEIKRRGGVSCVSVPSPGAYLDALSGALL